MALMRRNAVVLDMGEALNLSLERELEVSEGVQAQLWVVLEGAGPCLEGQDM